MSCDPHTHSHVPSSSRRGALRAIVLGGGAALLTSLPMAARAGHVDVLLLSCMDYRLMDEVSAYMQGRAAAERDGPEHASPRAGSASLVIARHGRPPCA